MFLYHHLLLVIHVNHEKLLLKNCYSETVVYVSVEIIRMYYYTKTMALEKLSTQTQTS